VALSRPPSVNLNLGIFVQATFRAAATVEPQEAAFSPMGVDQRALQLVRAFRARFFSPAGTSIGGRGLSGRGSTSGPSGRSVANLPNTGAGKCNSKGTSSLWDSFDSAPTRGATIHSKLIFTSLPVRIGRNGGEGGSISKSVILSRNEPLSLSFLSAVGRILTGMVTWLVTPAMARSPLAFSSPIVHAGKARKPAPAFSRARRSALQPFSGELGFRYSGKSNQMTDIRLPRANRQIAQRTMSLLE